MHRFPPYILLSFLSKSPLHWLLHMPHQSKKRLYRNHQSPDSHQSVSGRFQPASLSASQLHSHPSYMLSNRPVAYPVLCPSSLIQGKLLPQTGKRLPANHPALISPYNIQEHLYNPGHQYILLQASRFCQFYIHHW